MASASVVEFSFFTVIGSVVYILLRYPFWYLIFSVFMARGAEIRTGDRSRPGLLGSFRLPLQILPGHWWGTWVLLFSAWALFMVVGYLVTLPSSLGMEILKMLSIEPEYDATTKKMVETIFMTINEFARTLVNCSFCVVLGIHFYSLKESKHGYTITEQLNQIGHTQPDDHVEYVY
jgi:phage-related holin